MENVTLANGRVVGESAPPYVIAEIGANHNGDMDLCRRLVDAAKAAGADAVKFQSWSAKSLISEAEYERHTTYDDTKKHFGSLREMVERYQLTTDQHREVAGYCAQQGIDFLSTPFSPAEVDLLVDLDVAVIKVASMDVNHLPLLEYMAHTGRPVMVSTGMATTAEIARAVETLTAASCSQLILLHCVSIYPPEPETVNLRNIIGLRQTFGVPVGFSDHTIGVGVPLAAVALGACVIEKHFTLDKNLAGWDHAISADPAELAIIAGESRIVRSALGSTVRTVSEAEQAKRTQFRRRIVVVRDVRQGERLTAADLDFKRPGTGIGPDELACVVGRKAAHDLGAERELEWSDLD